MLALSGPINILFYYTSAVQLSIYWACLIKKTEMVIIVAVDEMDFEAVK